MPKYDVEMSYTCQTTYNGVVTVEAKDEDEAESKALDKMQNYGAPLKDWEQDEDTGDFEVMSVEEVSDAE